MIARENQVVIFHLGEPFVFEIDKCSLKISDDGLDLDVWTRPNLDCLLGHLSAPSLHIESATVTANSLEDLKVERLDVASGWDTDAERKEDNIFRIDIGQHEALNNNRVYIAQRPDSRIEIRWHSEAQNFLDFRDPDCSLEVFCFMDAR